MFQSNMKEPKLSIKHLILADMLETDFAGNHNKQIMKIIYQQSQAHNNLSHKFQTH